MNDSNSAVARAIRDDLIARGLVSAERAEALEKAMCEGTLKAEDWYQAVEASLPLPEGSTHAGKAQ